MMRAVLIAALAACLPWSTQEPDGAAALQAADRAFCESTQAEGLEGWLGWFAPGAVIATHTGELRSGPGELRSYYTSIGHPPPRFGWESDAGQLAASGELGWTSGTWEIRAPGTPEGEGAVLIEGRYLTVWERQEDGAWRVLADTGGRTDVRARVDEVTAPPLEWSSRAERTWRAESGELAFVLGTWSARTEAEEREGSLLTVWEREAEDAWVVATEIGFDH